MDIDASLNVFGERLESCGENPVTGFFRDGCCNTSDDDIGSHTVCIEVTNAFLEYSRFRGNDLTTPLPDFGFPGLKAGDKWCLCAQRWLEAYQHDMAPKVFLMRTHQKATDIVPMQLLKLYAADLN
jgi:uncharacterized protein (DUF2237 family)